MSFGEKVRELRKAAGLSQADLAAQLDRPQARISTWELGTGYPRPATLLKMAAALAVQVEDLCRADTGQGPEGE